MLHFRIHLRHDIKVFLVEYDANWSVIANKVSLLFEIPPSHVVLVYRDRDGTVIKLSNQEELRSYLLGPKSARAVAVSSLSLNAQCGFCITTDLSAQGSPTRLFPTRPIGGYRPSELEVQHRVEHSRIRRRRRGIRKARDPQRRLPKRAKLYGGKIYRRRLYVCPTARARRLGHGQPRRPRGRFICRPAPCRHRINPEYPPYGDKGYARQ
ncbi:hypothetical protein M408DRAFT_157574 [Serendipita vermifera MAFF 305830]|uniref:PB1 domain-containing protein n=1 Tax=Serendipita vermifera MAFF 305830 TaxID=933852 RepID=A0A0C2X6C2_SERVB|nr:hypothetical protein M408DRAFT_157574 [Serendipita vermifera MAFF 305830]